MRLSQGYFPSYPAGFPGPHCLRPVRKLAQRRRVRDAHMQCLRQARDRSALSLAAVHARGTPGRHMHTLLQYCNRVCIWTFLVRYIVTGCIFCAPSGLRQGSVLTTTPTPAAPLPSWNSSTPPPPIFFPLSFLLFFFPKQVCYGAYIKSMRSIEKKSLNLRLEGRWVGINIKIHRPFASLELARCVKHQTHARHAYCRGFESRLELFSWLFFFALKYDVHNVHCGLFRQSSHHREKYSQRLIFLLYPSRLRQIKCKPVWGKKRPRGVNSTNIFLIFRKCSILSEKLTQLNLPAIVLNGVY